MKVNLFCILLLASACSAKQTETKEMSIEDVIAESLQLDNIQPAAQTLENDVSSTSLKNELSKAFSKIVASTPLKNENLPPNEEEIDNTKTQEDLQDASQKSEHVSEKSGEMISQGSETGSPKDLASEHKSTKTLDEGLEASIVSGTDQSIAEDEKSKKTDQELLDELESQSQQIDNLESTPLDTDEEDMDQELKSK